MRLEAVEALKKPKTGPSALERADGKEPEIKLGVFALFPELLQSIFEGTA